MKNLRLKTNAKRAFAGTSRGFTLIEVLVALALVGIIAIAFLGGLSTASRAVLIADVRTNAESLARSQLEYVKSQDYSPAPWDYEITSSNRSPESDDRPDWWDPGLDVPPLLSDEYAGYTVSVAAEPLGEEDDGIQKITVAASHHSRAGIVITLEGYKVSR